MKSRLRKVRCWARVPSRGKVSGIYATKAAAKSLLKRGEVLCKLEGMYVEPSNG